MNIIENSRKGAASDSAYGYKDSVNKYYVSELSNNNKLMLNGTYEVKANGVLNGNFGVTENAEDRTIPIDGTKPSSGKLRYSNNVLNAGCIVIGDYKVTFGTDGKVNNTVKGNCDDYEFPTSETTNNYLYTSYETDGWTDTEPDESMYIQKNLSNNDKLDVCLVKENSKICFNDSDFLVNNEMKSTTISRIETSAGGHCNGNDCPLLDYDSECSFYSDSLQCSIEGGIYCSISNDGSASCFAS